MKMISDLHVEDSLVEMLISVWIHFQPFLHFYKGKQPIGLAFKLPIMQLSEFTSVKLSKWMDDFIVTPASGMVRYRVPVFRLFVRL